MENNKIDRISNLLSRLAKEHAAEGYEGYMTEIKKLSITVDDKKSVEELHADEEYAIAIRTLKDQRLGFSFSFSLSDTAIEEAFKRALDTGSILNKHPFAFADNKPDTSAPEAFYDGRIKTISGGYKIEILKRMVDAAYLDKRIIKVEKPSYEEAETSAAVLNSAGIFKKFRATRFGIGVSVLAKENDESQMTWNFQGSNLFSHLKPEEISRDCAEQALHTLGGIQLLTGFYDAVLTQFVASQFLSILSTSFLADSVYKKTSMLSARLHQQIFPEYINILDDPHLEDGAGSAPFDAEGVPTVKKTVVGKGVVNTFLYDKYYALLMNTQTSGNAIRHAVTNSPSIGVTNLALISEKVSERSLKYILHNGPVITELMGLHTANSVTGEFSLGARGYIIKAGKFSSPLKDITIAGNIFDLFNNIEIAGPDQVLYGNMLTAPLLIRGLKIAGAGG